MTRLRDLAPLYDGFLIDQFGVLHDGHHAYTGAAQALAALHDLGRTIVLVSNSGRRAAYNADRLARLGIPASSYDHFVTSGEVAWAAIRDGSLGVPPGAPCHLVARTGDTSPVEGLDLRLVTVPEARLIYLAGVEPEHLSREGYAARLEPAARAGVPMICTNPDLEQLMGGGTKAFGAGQVARDYAAMGGPVTWVGKPHPAIYAAALALMPPGARVIGIGDSPEHDIAGASGAGLDTALVLGGVGGDGPAATWTLDRFAW